MRRALCLLALLALVPWAPSAAAETATRAAQAQSTPSIGRICRSGRLQGHRIDPIPGSLPGCGLRNGVKVYAVDGMRLSTPAALDCPTAKALEKWVRRGLKRSVRGTGGGVAELQVAAHYSCRTRNHRPGAPISEHGKGKAIDISAITLEDGQQISVLRDWGKGRNGRILKRAHRRACRYFGTVLGPGADRFHRDHFHFDTARHRGGAYCR